MGSGDAGEAAAVVDADAIELKNAVRIGNVRRRVGTDLDGAGIWRRGGGGGGGEGEDAGMRWRAFDIEENLKERMSARCENLEK